MGSSSGQMEQNTWEAGKTGDNMDWDSSYLMAYIKQGCGKTEFINGGKNRKRRS